MDRSEDRSDVEFGVPGYGMELNIHIHMEEGDPFIVPSTLIWSMSDCCDLFCRTETPVRQQSALHDAEKDVVHKDHQVRKRSLSSSNVCMLLLMHFITLAWHGIDSI